MEYDRVATCAERIKKALLIKGMKQSDLCRLTKIPKSALSQYISGAFEPKQDRIYLMAQALNVNETWLMGLDVPMERQDKLKETSSDKIELTEGENMLLELFRRVPEDKQELVLQMIRVALGNQE
jgi:transcriptional regulator with XRE-family HTH domain